MNIQIFGTSKSFDTKKAERYFKERGIHVQSVNLAEKAPSKGELENISRAVGGVKKLIDTKSKFYSEIAFLQDEDMFDKILECPYLLLIPIVRNGKDATIGYKPEIWKNWQ